MFDETDYIDTGSYAAYDPSGFYGMDTSSYQFDPSMFGDGGGAGAGAFDFGSLFTDPYMTDYSAPVDYTSAFADFSSPTDTYSPEQQASLWDTINSANSPIAQNQSAAILPNVLSGDFGQNNPSQSYVDQMGGIVGIPSSGADTQNSYNYATGPSGDTYVLDTATGKAVGYLDSSNQPIMYGDVALQNGAGLSDISNNPLGLSLAQQAAQKAASGGSSGGGSGGGGSQPKAQPQSTAQKAVGSLGFLAEMLQAIAGKGAKAPAGKGDNRSATPMQFSTKGLKGYKSGGLTQLGHIKHDSGGQDDAVNARLAGGEYVFDSDVVSALGDGNTAAGAAKLDTMRENIRTHKRAAPAHKIPPKAKSPLAYMKGAK